MSSREDLLKRLRERQRSDKAPGTWQSPRQYEDLAEQFALALTAANGEVRRAGSMDEALDHVGEVLEEIGAKTGLVNDQPPLGEDVFTSRWPAVAWHVVGHSEGQLRSFAASADIGISLAEVALAETGSVLVSSGPGRSRLTSLMPPVHLALVPTSCLTTDIFSWTSGLQPPFPASMTLISGPSKTGDIEQTMAIGVHGPGRFIALLYKDK